MDFRFLGPAGQARAGIGHDEPTAIGRAIERAVKKTGGNITEAARLLGIGRATLYRKLTTYSDG